MTDRTDADVVCEHGTAMDVHCCNCHSGFIFDKDHECPPPGHEGDWPQKCEGCGSQTDHLNYTSDEVGLCDGCFEACPIEVQQRESPLRLVKGNRG